MSTHFFGSIVKICIITFCQNCSWFRTSEFIGLDLVCHAFFICTGKARINEYVSGPENFRHYGIFKDYIQLRFFDMWLEKGGFWLITDRSIYIELFVWWMVLSGINIYYFHLEEMCLREDSQRITFNPVLKWTWKVEI